MITRHLLSLEYKHSNCDWKGYGKLARINLLLLYHETMDKTQYDKKKLLEKSELHFE